MISCKKLRGRRILIEKPVRPESAIELTPEVKEMLDREFMSRWGSLTVVAVGSDVEDVAAGDNVYVGSALATAEIIEHEGKHYIMVSEHDVAIVW